MNNEDENKHIADSVNGDIPGKSDKVKFTGRNNEFISREINLLKDSVANLQQENQLFLAILSASSLINMLTACDDKKRDVLIAEISPSFSEFEHFFQELLLEKVSNPMIFKLGEILLDELSILFSKMGFYEKEVSDTGFHEKEVSDTGFHEKEVSDTGFHEKEVKELDDEVRVFYSRNDKINDRWDLVAEVEKLIIGYEHLSHLKLSNFWKEAVLELHRYDYPLSTDYRSFIVNPSKIISLIVYKLLKEAPCAQILQRYRRRKGSSGELDQVVSKESINAIKNSVSKYNERLDEFIRGSSEDKGVGRYHGDANAVSREKMLSKAKTLLKKAENCHENFNLGSALTEMRIPQTYQKIIRNVIDEASELLDMDDVNFLEIGTKLLSVQLIYDLNNGVYKIKELDELMQEIKS